MGHAEVFLAILHLLDCLHYMVALYRRGAQLPGSIWCTSPSSSIILPSYPPCHAHTISDCVFVHSVCLQFFVICKHHLSAHNSATATASKVLYSGWDTVPWVAFEPVLLDCVSGTS